MGGLSSWLSGGGLLLVGREVWYRLLLSHACFMRDHPTPCRLESYLFRLVTASLFCVLKEYSFLCCSIEGLVARSDFKLSILQTKVGLQYHMFHHRILEAEVSCGLNVFHLLFCLVSANHQPHVALYINYS